MAGRTPIRLGRSRRYRRIKGRQTLQLIDRDRDNTVIHAEILDCSFRDVSQRDLQAISFDIDAESRTWRLPIHHVPNKPKAQTYLQEASGDRWKILVSRPGPGRVTWHCICVRRDNRG